MMDRIEQQFSTILERLIRAWKVLPYLPEGVPLVYDEPWTNGDRYEIVRVAENDGPAIHIRQVDR